MERLDQHGADGVPMPCQAANLLYRAGHPVRIPAQYMSILSSG
jgi:hypothetical protein